MIMIYHVLFAMKGLICLMTIPRLGVFVHLLSMAQVSQGVRKGGVNCDIWYMLGSPGSLKWIESAMDPPWTTWSWLRWSFCEPLWTIGGTNAMIGVYREPAPQSPAAGWRSRHPSAWAWRKRARPQECTRNTPGTAEWCMGLETLETITLWLRAHMPQIFQA